MRLNIKQALKTAFGWLWRNREDVAEIVESVKKKTAKEGK